MLDLFQPAAAQPLGALGALGVLQTTTNQIARMGVAAVEFSQELAGHRRIGCKTPPTMQWDLRLAGLGVAQETAAGP